MSDDLHDEPTKFAVVVDRNYYPHVDYFETRQEAETAAAEERADMLVEAGGEYEARVRVVEILACNDYKANH